jgi:hypothetical protein
MCLTKPKGIMGNNIFNRGSNQKPADVFDLKGNRIKNTDNIWEVKKYLLVVKL